MFKAFGRRVGLFLVAVLVLSALAVPAAAAETLASPGGRAVASQRDSYNSGGWGCSKYYVVRCGDTLTKLAYRYGTTVNALMRCNNIRNPDKIYVGQTLCICYPYSPPPQPKPQPCPQPCQQPCPQPCQQPCPQPCPPPSPKPCPPPQTNSWLGQYYNNTDLSGSPALVQHDPVLMFNWGYGSPAWQIQPDYFSAQWTRSFYMQGGTWRITLTVDDGARVFVDGIPVFDEWRVQSARTFIRDVVLPTGNHTFTVQYFEAEGLAEIGITIIRM
jgi:hypothetical protein